MKSLFQMVRSTDGVRSDVFVQEAAVLSRLLYESIVKYREFCAVFSYYFALAGQEFDSYEATSNDPALDFVLVIIDDVGGDSPSANISRAPLLTVNSFLRLYPHKGD